MKHTIRNGFDIFNFYFILNSLSIAADTISIAYSKTCINVKLELAKTLAPSLLQSLQ